MRTVHRLNLDDNESGEWGDLGRELRNADPALYLELRDIAERCVLAYTKPDDPLLRAPAHPVIASQRPKGVA